MIRRWCFCVVFLFSLPALAEPHTWKAPLAEPSTAAVQEAKALYIAGNRAVEQGRWSDALTNFEKSYSLSGVPAALYNVATTLRAIGRHVESRDAFTQLLAKHPTLDPDIKAQAEKLLAEEKAKVATASLDGVPNKARIYVDGHEVTDDGARPLNLEVDPGKHSLRVEDPRSKPFTWDGAFSDGEKKTISVKLVAADVPKPVAAEKSGGVLSSPWFWGAIGVVVIGGAAGAYFYDRSKQLGPESGVTVKL
jgi:hypothetical protein